MTTPNSSLGNDLLFYIKTTETCNLNCDHCFTNGKNGRKIYFHPESIADWCNRVKQYQPNANAHFEYHGGEPFLAPIEDMWKFYDLTQEHWPNATYGITTNLVHKLTPAKLEFIEKVLDNRIGTSWDPEIRFENQKQIDLFESNIKLLLDRGCTIKLFVSLTRDCVNIEPIKLLEYVKGLGVQEMDIERVTSNGLATKNLSVFPSNVEMQEWFLKMHEQMIEYNARHWFHNGFMENVYAKFEKGFTKAGTFCRDCEQKLFTINADGTIAGCPNSAPTDAWGHVMDDVATSLNAPKRCGIIAEELARDPRCYDCPVYKYCGGDCHQLAWEGDICPAPKLLMKELAKG
jgi:radical SAM protein with 4Fe4S-binding SPASM domain|tara:strand:- start:8067 stop:9104 length:1038 start_codon:yes stop_codon:yes gene_type:complete